LRNSAPRCQGNRAKSSAYQRLALRRLTPTTIRSARTRKTAGSGESAGSAGCAWGPFFIRMLIRAGATLRLHIYEFCQREPADEGRQSLKQMSVRCSRNGAAVK